MKNKHIFLFLAALGLGLFSLALADMDRGYPGLDRMLDRSEAIVVARILPRPIDYVPNVYDPTNGTVSSHYIRQSKDISVLKVIKGESELPKEKQLTVVMTFPVWSPNTDNATSALNRTILENIAATASRGALPDELFLIFLARNKYSQPAGRWGSVQESGSGLLLETPASHARLSSATLELQRQALMPRKKNPQATPAEETKAVKDDVLRIIDAYLITAHVSFPRSASPNPIPF